ncbi:MAG: DUF484 family protein [Candidatus Thiodiazotropha lotti]|uniref:Phytochrome sensor protein n=1 Tax=Candidatus Thiodiazotropha endoloripes TaxID=1818881 RepID=A0A1E2UN37_9GAMM|nr:DUF484 family protein [Candidatus Thiodiazotropha endoloripes]MCG7899994.1 DUF484 family protein [Candidatus Thiodiazotropha weberae]MCG7991384.1 DUF484 family protein [Candidatus Thiodiazotropha lotti]MCG7902894.1 DUF484 family protein [Candidatus Thiodiazotropha weberae]MCG7912575.1 DUF484 family protein [Candidatus Thiodiazotropha weberae]MCG8001096.1 DUF484 family protein [Candidatus Thiodiazotropha lotti]
MSHKAPNDPIKVDGTDQQIADYLRDNPGFLLRHPELLAEMEIPHASGDAVSLIERQVDALRKQLKDTQQQLANLVEVARTNDQLQARMHRLTLELIDAATFEEVLNALEDELHDDFKADAVELRLFSSSQLDDHLQDSLNGQVATFEQFFNQNQPICGKMDQQQLDYIFGTEGDRIASTALIPLKSEGVLGLLAIGSCDPERFAPDHGTEFLTRLGEIISRTLQAVSLPGI